MARSLNALAQDTVVYHGEVWTDARSYTLAGGREESPQARDIEVVVLDPDPVAAVRGRDRVETVPGQRLP